MAKQQIKSFFTAKNIAYLAVLLALVIVLQTTVGSIPIGVVQLNFSLVPIVLGAILFGLAGGAFLGFACGIVILVQVVTAQSGFYLIIWGNSPVVTAFTCILKTTIAGAVAGLIYRLISKKSSLAAAFVASALVPFFNTAIFIIGCLCMSGAMGEVAGEVLTGVDLLIFILVGIVTFNFFVELGINLVLAPAIHRVVLVVEKTIGKKRSRGHSERSEESQNTESENESAEHETPQSDKESENKS